MKADAWVKQIGSIPVPCTDTDISFLMFYWIYPFFSFSVFEILSERQ